MSLPGAPPPYNPGMAPPGPPSVPVKKKRNWLMIGILSVLGVCGVCGVIGIAAAVNGGNNATPTVAAIAPTTTPQGTAIAAAGQPSTATVPAAAAAKPTEAAKLTMTLKPEATVKPTNTPVPAKPTNTPIPAPKVFGPNELATVKNWDLAVAAVDHPGKEFVWSEFNNKSTAAGTWFIVALDMKNTGNTNFGVNTTDFELKAAGGITYKISTEGGVYAYPGYKKAQTVGGQVPPGVTVRYYLIFDVAPDASDLQLVFKQDTKPTFALGNVAP